MPPARSGRTGNELGSLHLSPDAGLAAVPAKKPRQSSRDWWVDPWSNPPPPEFQIGVSGAEQMPWFGLPGLDYRGPVFTTPDGALVESRTDLPLQPFARWEKLRDGDYALGDAVVERKSLADLFSSMGSTRKEQGQAQREARAAGKSPEEVAALVGREERKWQRLGAHDRALFVVEADYRQVLNPEAYHAPGEWRSGLDPSSVAGTLIAWSHRYHVEVAFLGDRRLAQWHVVRWLAAWWRDRQTEGRL